ncbi:MAG TPA: sterol desaturase family protein [Stellaceae bacterium]|nr:sterol desaturase family protein [Stellaceae bacterium]
MGRIVGLVVAFAALSALFALLQRAASSKAALPLSRRGFGTDALYWLFTALVTRPATRATVLIAALLLIALTGHRLSAQDVMHGHGPVALLPLWVQGAILLVAMDFVAYWSHRLFHGRALWRFHAIHHSSTDLDWLSATRLHPVNDVLTRLFQVAPFLALGAAPAALAGAAPILALYAIFIHADVGWDFGPLRYVIATPAFHRWHHALEDDGRDRNFAGLLPLWDLLFGTFDMPRGAAPARFGTASPVPQGMIGQMLYPFRA